MEHLYAMAARIPGNSGVGTEDLLVAGVGVHPDRESAQQAMTAETIHGLANFAPDRLTDTLEVMAVALDDTDVVHILVRLQRMRPDLIERAILIIDQRNDELVRAAESMNVDLPPTPYRKQAPTVTVTRDYLAFNNPATELFEGMNYVQVSIDTAKRHITFVRGEKGKGHKITLRKGQVTVACRPLIAQLKLALGARFPVEQLHDGGIRVQV